MSKRKWTKAPHPNSLAAKAEHDPKLKEAIRRGRKEADEDLRLFEAWYRRGCL